MTDKKRNQMKEEIFHDLVKGVEKNKGSVDAGDVSALATILRERAKSKEIHGLTVKETIDMQRAVLSDTGADPTKAMQQMKEKLDRERRPRRQR